jgi:hypothetical protein
MLTRENGATENKYLVESDLGCWLSVRFSEVIFCVMCSVLGGFGVS